jgi:hypothetical protein
MSTGEGRPRCVLSGYVAETGVSLRKSTSSRSISRRISTSRSSPNSPHRWRRASRGGHWEVGTWNLRNGPRWLAPIPGKCGIGAVPGGQPFAGRRDWPTVIKSIIRTNPFQEVGSAIRSSGKATLPLTWDVDGPSAKLHRRVASGNVPRSVELCEASRNRRQCRARRPGGGDR